MVFSSKMFAFISFALKMFVLFEVLLVFKEVFRKVFFCYHLVFLHSEAAAFSANFVDGASFFVII